MRDFPSFACTRFGRVKVPTLGEKFPHMAIPVFALGVNPHISAPLFYGKLEALKEGMKRDKIRKIGEHYFRTEQANYVTGPKPAYRETKRRSVEPERLPLAELPGLKFVPPNGIPMKRLIAISPEEAVGW